MMPAASHAPILNPTSAAPGHCCCVIVTRDRPALLARCLETVLQQETRPDRVLVVDSASGPDTRRVLEAYDHVHVLRLPENRGGAGGFQAGIIQALAWHADWIWLMDDDGRPHDAACLGGLLATAAETGAEIVGPLVTDIDQPDRLSFPIRIDGRTRFGLAECQDQGPLPGFVHLFNGALIATALFRRVGLPDARFFIRGDEVEFLYRAQRAGTRIVLDVRTKFLHPGSRAEIHPILFGLFYAVVPMDPTKQFYLFRNRAYIFRHHRMWLFLVADVVRYGLHFIVGGPADFAGLRRWFMASRAGWSGGFMRSAEAPTPSSLRSDGVAAEHATGPATAGPAGAA